MFGIGRPISLHLLLCFFSEHLCLFFQDKWYQKSRSHDRNFFSVLLIWKLSSNKLVGGLCHDPPGQRQLRLWVTLSRGPNLYILILTPKFPGDLGISFLLWRACLPLGKLSPGVSLKRANESLSAPVFADSASQGTNLKCSCSRPVFTFISSHIWRPKFINLSPSLTTVYWVRTLREREKKPSPDLSGVKWMEKWMGSP